MERHRRELRRQESGWERLGEKLMFFFSRRAVSHSWYKRECTAYGHRGRYKSPRKPSFDFVYFLCRIGSWGSSLKEGWRRRKWRKIHERKENVLRSRLGQWENKWLEQFSNSFPLLKKLWDPLAAVFVGHTYQWLTYSKSKPRDLYTHIHSPLLVLAMASVIICNFGKLQGRCVKKWEFKWRMLS